MKTRDFTGNRRRDAWPRETFDPDCRDCPRLAVFLGEVRRERPGYYAHPVPPFGVREASLQIVGLAPGMHGANRTGRPFTGDFAGILLYRTLHRFGFASHAGSDDPDDGLTLSRCRVTNAVKCLPPQNKPLPAEVRVCNRYLAAEIEQYPPRAILALGRIAHDAVLRARGLRPAAIRFAHHAVHELPGGIRLFDSYHCSRYNTQTRRLTEAMFEAVVRDIAGFLGHVVAI
ncbi:MAG: uracil-DNA glycosylase [Gammaproteobacteria bacterium]|nr:uracil-DNA glycosylase [Gammaproteobacteria bacterium]